MSVCSSPSSKNFFFHAGDGVSWEVDQVSDLLCGRGRVFDKCAVYFFFFWWECYGVDVSEELRGCWEFRVVLEIIEVLEEGGEVEEPVDVASFEGEDDLVGIFFFQ